MKNLHFVYDMHIAYSVEVSKCNFTLKCMPESNSRQSISNVTVSLIPAVPYSTGRDGLSNIQIYGSCDVPHKFFDLHLEGDATTGLCDYDEVADAESTMIFSHPHGLNIAGNNIVCFFSSIRLTDSDSLYDKAVSIMNSLHDSMLYKPFVTNTDTTAEQALSQRAGVCQDYAHIFIALLHLAKIPARYVTGFILGEGQSHAWVEIMSDGKWYGLDPTNNCSVSDNHIKIGVGRDARDCTINRGIILGGGMHTQSVSVYVSEQ